MPVSDIYSGNALIQPKSIQDFDNEALAAQIKRQGLQQNALELQQGRMKMDEYQRGLQEQGQLRNALSGLGAGATDQQRIDALKGTGLPGGFTQADALQKSLIEQEKHRSETSYKSAQTSELQQKTDHEKIKFGLQGLAAANSPQEAAMVALKAGLVPPEQADQYLASIPKDPAGYADWKGKQMMQGVELSKQFDIKAAQARDAESQRHNKSTESLTARGQNMQDARSAATIAKDYKVAGIDPQTGNFVGAGAGPDAGSGMAGMVDALGSYKMDPSTAFSRMAPAMKAGVIAAVQQKYPDYDPSTYGTKVKAAKDFGSGSQGNAMRSFAVAGQHLDQLGTLVDALGNRDTQLLNKIGNAYATQTGNPAPTNFDAAKDVVGKEVVKAIVAGGGGVAERQELSNLMSQAKSPAQLKGVIAQYRNLMSAQHDALLQQRDAAGLPRSTLPKYTDASASPAASAHPPEIADLLNKYGKK